MTDNNKLYKITLDGTDYVLEKPIYEAFRLLLEQKEFMTKAMIKLSTLYHTVLIQSKN